MRIVYAHDKITPEEVIRFLIFTGQSDYIFVEIIKLKEAMKKAKESDIIISDGELQDFADSYRAMRGLHSAEDTLKFFEDAGVTEADFELFCESSVLTAALKEHLASENRIREYFVNHRSQFDLARISIALVQNENMANEIIMQVTEDSQDFHALVRQFSVDEETKYAGGYVGSVTREMLPAVLAAKVFNATGGDLVGPIRRGEFFQVILVEEVIKGELSEEVKETIKERIFQGWITKHMEGSVKIQS